MNVRVPEVDFIAQSLLLDLRQLFSIKFNQCIVLLVAGGLNVAQDDFILLIHRDFCIISHPDCSFLILVVEVLDFTT